MKIKVVIEIQGGVVVNAHSDHYNTEVYVYDRDNAEVGEEALSLFGNAQVETDTDNISEEIKPVFLDE